MEGGANLNANAERLKELEKVIGVQESKIQNLLSSAFQLANYYFVFQGVVLAAIYNTSSLTCTDPWLITFISLIAALLNLCALFNIASDYVRVMDQHEQTWSDYNKLAAAGSMNPPAEDEDYWTDHFSQRKRKAILGVCVILFLVSTAATLAGPWRVSCKHDRKLKNLHLPHDNSESGCLKLCDQSSRCMLFCQDIQ